MITIYKPEELDPVWNIDIDYNSTEELWDFPFNEVNYLLDTQENGKFVLLGDRLYELPKERWSI